MIALIPARGGSKGIPRKNIVPLNGIPLIQWTIVAAKQSNSVDRVLVSTDCAQIAEISSSAGAEIIHRPGQLATDWASTDAVVHHAVEEIGYTYDKELIALLQCTSPFRNSIEIDAMHKFHVENKYDSSFSGILVEQFLWRYDSESSVSPVNYDPLNRPRRQDRHARDMFIRENGATYIFTFDGFKNTNSRLHGRIGAFLSDEISSFEIDTHHDLELAEKFSNSM